MSTEKLTKKLAGAMRQSDNKMLWVIADMDEHLSDLLMQLAIKYSELDHGGDPAPTPKDFLIGMALYFMSQYDIFTQATFKKEEEFDYYREILASMATTSPRQTIVSLMLDAKIDPEIFETEH